MNRVEMKNEIEKDLELTAWATDVFLKSTGSKAHKTDKFMLGAHYVNNHPSGYFIIRVNRLINYYEDLVIFNKKFINRGYIKFVQNHWNDNFDMDCELKDMHIELLPEEIDNTK